MHARFSALRLCRRCLKDTSLILRAMRSAQLWISAPCWVLLVLIIRLHLRALLTRRQTFLVIRVRRRRLGLAGLLIVNF